MKLLERLLKDDSGSSKAVEQSQQVSSVWVPVSSSIRWICRYQVYWLSLPKRERYANRAERSGKTYRNFDFNESIAHVPCVQSTSVWRYPCGIMGSKHCNRLRWSQGKWKTIVIPQVWTLQAEITVKRRRVTQYEEQTIVISSRDGNDTRDECNVGVRGHHC